MKPEDLLKLKGALTNPGGQLKPEYAGKSHPEIAEMLRAEATGIDRERMTGGEIAASIVASEYNSLSTNAKNLLGIYVNAGEMPITSQLKTELSVMFPQNSGTRGNLLSLMKRRGTVAEFHGLPSVTESDVADALLRT